MGNILGCTGDDADDSMSKARRRCLKNALTATVTNFGVGPTEKTLRETEKTTENLLNAMMEEQKAVEDILQDRIRNVNETQDAIEYAMAQNDLDNAEIEKALIELQKEVDDEEEAAKLMNLFSKATTGEGSRRTRKHKKRKRKYNRGHRRVKQVIIAGKKRIIYKSKATKKNNAKYIKKRKSKKNYKYPFAREHLFYLNRKSRGKRITAKIIRRYPKAFNAKLRKRFGYV